jgi:hypothetical protein
VNHFTSDVQPFVAGCFFVGQATLRTGLNFESDVGHAHDTERTSGRRNGVWRHSSGYLAALWNRAGVKRHPCFFSRRAAGETLAEIAKSYAVDISMISRLAPGFRAPFEGDDASADRAA